MKETIRSWRSGVICTEIDAENSKGEKTPSVLSIFCDDTNDMFCYFDPHKHRYCCLMFLSPWSLYNATLLGLTGIGLADT
jgi:hypothetical protein